LYVLQNAKVFKNAEKFFRKAVTDRSASWNSRVEHMFNTLLTLLDFHGDGAKAIIWAHNTHIGDARFTDMHQQNQVNIGLLTREHFGEDKTLLVGFGTYKGKVTAGRQWGSDMLELNLPAAMPGSIEDKLHSAHHGDYLLVMNPELDANPYFSEPIGNRAVGVVYNPEQERPGNYVPTVFGKRYDCFIFIEKTKPLRYVD
jgi:erythromycin esterase